MIAGSRPGLHDRVDDKARLDPGLIAPRRTCSSRDLDISAAASLAPGLDDPLAGRSFALSQRLGWRAWAPMVGKLLRPAAVVLGSTVRVSDPCDAVDSESARAPHGAWPSSDDYLP